MPKKIPTDVLDQASDVLTACKRINDTMKIGSLSVTEFSDEIAQAQAIQAEIQALEVQLMDLRNKRDERLFRTWENIKRARYSVKGAYGDDSSEYELVGGTRMSERRRPTRR